MEEKLLNLANKYFYFIFILIGLFIIIGAILDWKWLTRMESSSKLAGIRAFIEGLHGVEGRYKFERFITFCVGLIIFIAGIFYWYYHT